jgi:hypothetical protein
VLVVFFLAVWFCSILSVAHHVSSSDRPISHLAMILIIGEKLWSCFGICLVPFCTGFLPAKWIGCGRFFLFRRSLSARSLPLCQYVSKERLLPLYTRGTSMQVYSHVRLNSFIVLIAFASQSTFIAAFSLVHFLSGCYSTLHKTTIYCLA